MHQQGINRYFKDELDKVGYSEFRIEWCLNHVQSDGVWISGYPDIDVLSNRLMSGTQLAAITRTENEGVSPRIKIDKNKVWFDNGWCDNDEDPGEMTEFQRQAWIDFRKLILDDIKEITRKFQQEGYKLYHATSPMWWFKGKHLKFVHDTFQRYLIQERTEGPIIIQWWLWEDEYFDPYLYGFDEGEDLCKKMIAGEQVAFTAHVAIIERQSLQEVAAENINATDHPDIEWTIATLFPMLEEEAKEGLQGLIPRLEESTS